MPQGTIINVEPTTGMATIQPDDGGQNLTFHQDDADGTVQKSDVVNFDIDAERRASTSSGVQAVNIKIVK